MRSKFPIIACILILLAGAASAQDIREAARKAVEDRSRALREARETERRILEDRRTLRSEMDRLQALVDRRRKRIEAERAAQDSLRTGIEDLEARWSKMEMNFREISGNVRMAARDLETLLRRAAARPGDADPLARIAPLLEEGYFPDIDDIAALAAVGLEEIAESGQVRIESRPYVGRDGLEVEGPVLSLGPFTSMYRTPKETGFLQVDPDSRRRVALSSLPSRGMRRDISAYMDGNRDAVPLDMSRGAALQQIEHSFSLGDQLRAGGLIVWPILLLALASIVIVIERFVFLRRVHGNTDRLMGTVTDLASRGDWDACDRIVREHENKGWPVVRVLRAGLGSRTESRGTVESVLQESILREMPNLERYLSALAIIGAVAPLLGLLGTVTGMITTFRTITLFGTGDPKLMSGGISEALVTTELGLIVAIPVMLLHTYLSRRADHIVCDLEEKAVTLTNIIEKGR